MEFSCGNYILIKDGEIFKEYEIKADFERRSCILFKVVRYYEEIESTQPVIKGLAERGFGEGIIVVAEKQTGSYGRFKRKWNSGAGGLWFTMLLRPVIRPRKASELAFVFSIALKRVLEKKYKIVSEIKWPNDVLIFGKKVAGILIEMSAQSGSIINWIAAGIGINVNNDLPEYLERISISLKNVLEREVNRSEFLFLFLTEFEDIYFDFQKSGFKCFWEEYNDELAYKNKTIAVEDGYSVIIGENLGIDESGRLLVRTENTVEKIVSGTVRLAGE
jgi:BirA family biotin operon repressor/biotin-[acetyl-CoA-carboxylase] ligase